MAHSNVLSQQAALPAAWVAKQARVCLGWLATAHPTPSTALCCEQSPYNPPVPQQESVLVIAPSAALDCADCVKEEAAGPDGAPRLLVPPRLNDAQLLRLLEPYRRYRVWRLSFEGVGDTARAFAGFASTEAATAFDRRMEHITTDFCCRQGALRPRAAARRPAHLTTAGSGRGPAHAPRADLCCRPCRCLPACPARLPGLEQAEGSVWGALRGVGSNAGCQPRLPSPCCALPCCHPHASLPGCQTVLTSPRFALPCRCPPPAGARRRLRGTTRRSRYPFT